MDTGWVASVAAGSDRDFVGYRTEREESTPYERGEDGRWKDAVSGEAADEQLNATLDFLCEEAGRRGVDALAGTYGANGPEVTAQEGIRPRAERSDQPEG